ncbi:unnamed protein product [Diplocarpon coronariae]
MVEYPILSFIPTPTSHKHRSLASLQARSAEPETDSWPRVHRLKNQQAERTKNWQQRRMLSSHVGAVLICAGCDERTKAPSSGCWIVLGVVEAMRRSILRAQPLDDADVNDVNVGSTAYRRLCLAPRLLLLVPWDTSLETSGCAMWDKWMVEIRCSHHPTVFWEGSDIHLIGREYRILIADSNRCDAMRCDGRIRVELWNLEDGTLVPSLEKMQYLTCIALLPTNSQGTTAIDMDVDMDMDNQHRHWH